MRVSEPSLSPEEFGSLPVKAQLAVIYRTLVSDSRENTIQKWTIRGLVASNAAQWIVLLKLLFP